MNVNTDQTGMGHRMASGCDVSPFDLWVGRELKRSYAACLAEPLPDDLLRLLQDGPSPDGTARR